MSAEVQRIAEMHCRPWRCAGCGEYMDAKDVDGPIDEARNYIHTVAKVDRDGYPYPDYCGPVHGPGHPQRAGEKIK